MLAEIDAPRAAAILIIKGNEHPPEEHQPKEIVPSSGEIPWLAPSGSCQSCDKRRAAGVEANKAARKRREKKPEPE